MSYRTLSLLIIGCLLGCSESENSTPNCVPSSKTHKSYAEFDAVGAWVQGDDLDPNVFLVFVLRDDGTYFSPQVSQDGLYTCVGPPIEVGQWSRGGDRAILLGSLSYPIELYSNGEATLGGMLPLECEDNCDLGK